jgi:D-threo-aldose 1-dehydrogenase|tara:strand:- start:451 stop:1491 length:1041 start_codon:yes stop_codon:yes gene_type:complete
MKKNLIGKTNLSVTELGIGTAPIGGWPKSLEEKKALETLETAWGEGIRYFDTAPFYGYGMAEERLGKFLKNKIRDEYVISTKVGRIIIDSDKTSTFKAFFQGAPKREPYFDFSYDATLKSFEDSLKRLQLEKIDILLIHDPDNHFKEAINGSLKAIQRLKDEKVISAVGCGMNQNEMLTKFANTGLVDCFLLAGRFTLLDQRSLDKLLPTCEKNHVSLIIGGVFNSGILINPSSSSFFDYVKLNDSWLENAKQLGVRMPKSYESNEYWLNKANKINEICNKHKVDLKTAALKFPYLNKNIATVLTGVSSKEEVLENFNSYSFEINEDLWNELEKENLIQTGSTNKL